MNETLVADLHLTVQSFANVSQEKDTWMAGGGGESGRTEGKDEKKWK